MIHYFITLFTIIVLSSHNTITHAFQEKDSILNNQDHLMVSIQKELRSPEYRKEILPHDFSHLSHLVAYGTRSHQPPAYIRSIVKLFSNLIKSSHHINAYAFSDLLETFPEQLAPYFSLVESRAYITDSALYDATFVDRFKTTVNNMLYAKFSNEYDSFRQDPNLFLQKISNNIVTIAQEEVAQEQLRQGIIRFCEIALSKLVWSPTAHEETWRITKKIGEQLAIFLEHNILDDINDLDDLHWTLLNRYCYFLELTAGDMPESFYQAIRNDLCSNADNIVLFALKEQDYIVEPKLSYMQRTLLETETAAYRHKAGL
ncbi:MAG TPA: hypothetical protein VHX42_00160 [Candidatus Babeliales bacterium]|jgi:hypothetical protein|nr:hypothetical protein [Candidatus Babeliales bacterium]